MEPETDWGHKKANIDCRYRDMTYMSISEVLAQTCWSSATTAKIWPLQNFCQFFPRQKLEVNKIGSSATRPLQLNISDFCRLKNYINSSLQKRESTGTSFLY